MTKRELAKQLGISTRTIEHWLEKGLPCRKTKTGACQFDVRRVQQWYQDTIKSPTPSDPAFKHARARKEEALAQTHELNVSVRKGQLVEVAAASKLAFATFREARDAFQLLPDRLSGPLAAESDQHAVHTALTTETRRILEDLSNTIEGWPYAPPVCDHCGKNLV